MSGLRPVSCLLWNIHHHPSSSVLMVGSSGPTSRLPNTCCNASLKNILQHCFCSLQPPSISIRKNAYPMSLWASPLYCSVIHMCLESLRDRLLIRSYLDIGITLNQVRNFCLYISSRLENLTEKLTSLEVLPMNLTTPTVSSGGTYE